MQTARPRVATPAYRAAHNAATVGSSSCRSACLAASETGLGLKKAGVGLQMGRKVHSPYCIRMGSRQRPITPAKQGPGINQRNTFSASRFAPRSQTHQPSDCYHYSVFKIKSIFAFGSAKPDPGRSRPAFNGIRTVFVDRDGVLNEKMPEGLYVAHWRDFHVLPRVPEALRQLNEAGMLVLAVSNQRGIAQGLYTMEDVDAIHNSFRRLLEGWGARVDAFFICPHHIGECNCRKPLPGLYEQAVARFPDIKPTESIVIGDSLSDIEFGKRIGMKTIFVEGNPERRSSGAEEAAKLADLSVASLAEAVDALLGKES